jgi:osmotically-inducible protein OsmY
MEHRNDKTSEEEIRLETHLQTRLGSRVRQVRVESRSHGVVLRGRARTYYAKQLAQQFVMEMTDQPILANEIEVG